MAEQPTRNYRGLGRVAFLAGIDKFRSLLEAGYPLKLIFDNHKDQLGIGYPQFTKYVSRYIRAKKRDFTPQKSEESSEVASTEKGPSMASTGALKLIEDITGETSKQAGLNKPVFQHNPNSGNDRDDLI